MFCDNCGKEIPEGSVFCPECGASVNNGQTVPANENAAQTNIPYNGEKGDAPKKKLNPVKLIIIIVAVLCVGIGAAAGMIHIKSKPEVEYKANMTAFCKDLKDAYDREADLFYAVLNKYSGLVDRAENLGFSNPKHDDGIGTYILFANDEDDEFFTDTAAKLNARTDKLAKDYKKLYDPPKRYKKTYEEIKPIYEFYLEYSKMINDKTTYTSATFAELDEKEDTIMSEALNKYDTVDIVVKNMPEPFGAKFDIFKNISNPSSKKVAENLEIAKTIYNGVNTAIVDCKAQKGNYPGSKELAELLNGDNKLVTVPKGKTVAINYSESDHNVINVWVCTSKKGITGTDKDKALACYDPAINADKREAETEDPTESTTGGATENTTGSAEVGVEGNAAQTADFEYTLLCVNGGEWKVK